MMKEMGHLRQANPEDIFELIRKTVDGTRYAAGVGLRLSFLFFFLFFVICSFCNVFVYVLVWIGRSVLGLEWWTVFR
jgi:hypothetical protein